jgi:hypothetical protein
MSVREPKITNLILKKILIKKNKKKIQSTTSINSIMREGYTKTPLIR